MLHKNILPSDNHAIVSWIVADAAALAALVPVAADIGKVALQQSPFDVLILKDYTGPVWTSFFGAAGGASAVSVADAGGFFTGVNVETVLQEVGTSLAALDAKTKQVIAVAISDEITNLTTGLAKVTIHLPYNFDLSEVIAGVSVAQTAGSILQFDINVNAATILSTKLTIDNSEKTSITAATPAVITSGALNKGDEITFDIDTVGTPLAKGAKIYLIGKVRP